MSSVDLQALWLTLKLATVSTLVLLLIGTPLAVWLTKSRSPLKPVVETFVALPLVLPPTVLGFYLLLLLGAQGPVGRWSVHFTGAPLAFSFTGLVIGSVVYSLPFVVQPLQHALATSGERFLEAAATLGAGPVDRFFTVSVPLAARGFVVAITLGFAHTLGEFGVVLMLGGNIPGVTEVASVAIYNHVEALEYGSAHRLSAVLLGVSFAILFLVYLGKNRTPWPN
ncbi:MAG: molybdate ABC transporter permease subunit [Pseudomonadota bacterium]|nr:molybdate ABC transporter permease subunit [Pseudomonadota bacterium]